MGVHGTHRDDRPEYRIIFPLFEASGSLLVSSHSATNLIGNSQLFNLMEGMKIVGFKETLTKGPANGQLVAPFLP